MEARKKVLALGLCALCCAWMEAPASAQDFAARATAASSSAASSSGDLASPVSVSQLPDSPGTVLARLGEPAQPRSALLAALPEPGQASQNQSGQNQSGQNQGSQNQGSQNPPGQNQSTEQQQAPQRPVGTAASEAPNASGVAASQPAGVAIAPAKQRRKRTLVLKMGAIIGGAAAVGAVVALTAATSSRPPGAH